MTKTLSIVIPVFNEAQRLDKAVKGLLSWEDLREISLSEVIWVNDGSTDETLNLLKLAKSTIEKKLKVDVKILSHATNKGKGHAVKRGMLEAKCDYALMLDADMSTPMTEMKKVTEYIAQGVPVIIGTRKNGESTVQMAQPLHRQVLGRVFTLLSQVVLNTWVSDFTCGFKLFERSARHEIFRRSKIDRWGYDAEILFLAKQLDFGMKEKALLWYNDERSRVRLVRDSVGSLVELVRVRDYWLIGAYNLPGFHDTLVKKVAAWAFQSYSS